MATKTPHTKLMQVAVARYAEGLPWNVAAGVGGISDRGLRAIRQRRDPKWLACVQRVLEDLEEQSMPTALGCLVRMAARNDVTAAKAIYERLKAAKLELTGAGGGAVQVNHAADAEYIRRSIEGLLAREAGGDRPEA